MGSQAAGARPCGLAEQKAEGLEEVEVAGAAAPPAAAAARHRWHAACGNGLQQALALAGTIQHPRMHACFSRSPASCSPPVHSAPHFPSLPCPLVTTPPCTHPLVSHLYLLARVCLPASSIERDGAAAASGGSLCKASGRRQSQVLGRGWRLVWGGCRGQQEGLGCQKGLRSN